MHYKSLIIPVVSLATLVASGCAQIPDESASAQPVSIKQPDTPLSATDALSNGQSVTLTTSQGEIRVDPAVVSMEQTVLNGDPETLPAYYDPWEGFNRAMFSFNNGAYKYVLTPVSNGYRAVVPAPARQSVGNFFDNLREPLNLLNHLFAGEVKEAGSNLGRFVINSTIGLLGLFDPATSVFEVERQPQSIGDTLAVWGIEPGPYLVLPLLGQSDARSGVSVLAEGFVHPVNHVRHAPHNYQLRAVDGVDDFSSQSDTYHTLYSEAEDPYVFFRNQYLQAQKRDMWFGKQADSRQQVTPAATENEKNTDEN